MSLVAVAAVLAACGRSDDAEPATPTEPPSTTALPEAIGTDRAYDVEVTDDLVYGTGATTGAPIALHADVFEPVGATGPRPAVVMIHGGGFTSGTRKQTQWRLLGDALAGRGIVAISIDYRLRDDEPVTGDEAAPWQEAVGTEGIGVPMVAAAEDLVAALHWLTTDADLDVDPDRIGLMGGSAGAITAANVAYAADDLGVDAPPIRAVISFWGALGFATPADALDRDEADLLLIHGTADETVPFARSQELADAAEAAGIPVELVELEGQGHGFAGKDLTWTQPSSGRSLVEEVVAFSAAHLN